MDFEQKTISYYDSMGGIERSYVHGMGTEIPTGSIHAPSQKDMDMKGWSLVVHPRDLPQQENGKCIGC